MSNALKAVVVVAIPVVALLAAEDGQKKTAIAAILVLGFLVACEYVKVTRELYDASRAAAEDQPESREKNNG